MAHGQKLIYIRFNKNNRKIYGRIHKAVLSACKKHNLQVVTNLRKELSLIITCCRTPSKILDARRFASINNIPLVAMDASIVDKNAGLLSIDKRDELRQDNNENLTIYCEYEKKYIRNQKETRVNWVEKEESGDQYILIPEQINPECYNKVFNTEYWRRWFKTIYSLIDKDIIVSKHPNRKFWPIDDTFYRDLGVKLVDPPFSKYVKNAQKIYSLSSWAVLEGIMMKKDVGFFDSFCPIHDYKQENASQWLKDFSWCFWTLQEISHGEYFDYFLNVLNKKPFI